MVLISVCGPGSSVGIATELRAGRSGIESLELAVDYLQSERIVHRDIKSGNILLDKEDLA